MKARLIYRWKRGDSGKRLSCDRQAEALETDGRIRLADESKGQPPKRADEGMCPTFSNAIISASQKPDNSNDEATRGRGMKRGAGARRRGGGETAGKGLCCFLTLSPPPPRPPALLF